MAHNRKKQLHASSTEIDFKRKRTKWKKSQRKNSNGKELKKKKIDMQ